MKEIFLYKDVKHFQIFVVAQCDNEACLLFVSIPNFGSDWAIGHPASFKLKALSSILLLTPQACNHRKVTNRYPVLYKVRTADAFEMESLNAF